MQLGFVIDHSKCIGCHACTIACKSENNVPLGDFRTWVKYTERGTFPEVKRSFAVLRCNQCSEPPCVEICPTVALTKGENGIVDIDPKWCVGCKSCTQACPYDSIYINEDKGTAEKCHFCAHRVEEGLAPACAVVCPTEAIIPGDFENAASRVAKLVAEGDLELRKAEALTKPNVFYKEAAPAGLEPLTTTPKDGYLWANRRDSVSPETEDFLADLMGQAQAAANGDGAAQGALEDLARTTYDVDRKVLWGGKVSGYLMTKSLSAGLILTALPLAWGAESPMAALGLPTALALVFLVITLALLIGDLKRPERFYFLLTHPNWDSWLVRGGIILSVFGALLAFGLLDAIAGLTSGGGGQALGVASAVVAAAAAGYTGSLFAQAKGRVLWMQRGLWPTLIVQALIAGASAMLLLGPLLDGIGGISSPAGPSALHGILIAGLGLHLAWFFFGHKLGPRGEEAVRDPEYQQAWALFASGPRALVLRLYLAGWVFAILALGLSAAIASEPWAAEALWWLDGFAAVLALAGLHRVEHDFVQAGQELPIS